ncbi:TonB-dependent receptor [Allosphingosinicella deserti]|uniref:Cyclic nucleotide-binding protein n=1 Tax=Allosphingosinicella deserti TaxID=2116704 RepID=A0A2P7QPF2_9SPHN|nr:TonB-dependent receptor [Sphingomonas deserti]PSJ39830.1 cyclic nucleotide-binding protein [Sphingomonas deserti]
MSRSTGLARGGLASLLLAGSMPALAQAEANLESSAAAEEMAPNSDEEIIVTGRAGAGERTKLETSYAVTTLENETLRSRAASSVTETLKSVPGFWVEASGGEGSGNVRARGIPVDGFGSINLLEDGLPVQHDPSLGYLNADQAFRVDESIERIEVVRGGPASIFTSNAPGGVINFITKTPGDTLSGNARILYGPTADLFRFDGWVGVPIADGWGLGIGGFYRNEDGVRDPGYTGNKGGQIRADLTGRLDQGYVRLSYKRLDDRAIFYTGIPLTKDAQGDIVGIAGFDPQYDTTASRSTAFLNLRSAFGPLSFDNTDGSRIRLDQYSALVDYDLPGGWKLSNRSRYRESETVRNGVYPASISTAAAFVAGRQAALLAAFPGANRTILRYADTGEAFDIAGQNGNGLVFQNSARPVAVDEREFLNDFRVAWTFDLFGQRHDIAIGFYYAHIRETFRRYSATTLQDVSGDSRLLDLIAVNAAGQVVGSASENGVLRYGSEFANGAGNSDTYALYLSDEWQVTPQLRIDAGLRQEWIDTQGTQEGTATVNLGDRATLADDQVLTGSGIFTPFDRSFDKLGFTVGANWQFSRNAGLFARYTSAFRLPSVGSFITSATAQPVTQDIKMWEAGFKYSSRLLSLYATAFNTDFGSFSIGNFVFNPATGGYTQQTEYADTRTYGIELEGTLRPVKWLDLTVNGTLQNPEFRNLQFTELVNGAPVQRDYFGNQLLRVPKLALRVTPAVTLLDGRFRAQMDVEHYARRFSDAANTSALPAYTVINASARFDLTPQISLWAYGDNLTNSIGLTEGNPRAGELTSGQANDLLFIGRPILGRSFRLAVDFRF